MRKLANLIGIFLMMMPFVASPASAAADVRIGINPTSGPQGSYVRSVGEGFPPGESIRILWDGESKPLSTLETTQDGKFDVTFQIPGYTQVGDHRIFYIGHTTYSLTFKVTEEEDLSKTYSCQLNLRKKTVEPTALLLISGKDWNPNQDLTLTAKGSSKTYKLGTISGFSDQGNWQYRYRVHKLPVGNYTLIAEQGTCTKKVNFTIKSNMDSDSGSPRMLFPWDKKDNPLVMTDDPHHWVNKSIKSGLDFGQAGNAPVRVLSMFDGEVTFVGKDSEFSCKVLGGKLVRNPTIKIRHSSGVEVWYLHMSKMSVEVGQEVNTGTVLGLSGNEGCSGGVHLHAELVQKGRHLDWRDRKIDGISVSDMNPGNDLYSSNVTR